MRIDPTDCMITETREDGRTYVFAGEGAGWLDVELEPMALTHDVADNRDVAERSGIFKSPWESQAESLVEALAAEAEGNVSRPRLNELADALANARRMHNFGEVENVERQMRREAQEGQDG